MSPQHASRAYIARRRNGVAGFVTLLVLGLLFILLPRGDAGPGTAAREPADAAPSREPVPAWLAWMPGGFPEDFAGRIERTDVLVATVVVAGDTLWMRASTETVPILGEVTCNRALMPALRGALQELVDQGLDDLIDVYNGCYAARTVARSSTAPPSNHAYGAAIDIDAPTNGYGDTTPAMDPRVVEVFERWVSGGAATS